MSFPRSQRAAVAAAWFVVAMTVASVVRAQSPTVPSVPTPTPVPASSFPSMPAAVPESQMETPAQTTTPPPAQQTTLPSAPIPAQQPAAGQQPATQNATPAYHDPLEAPIVLRDQNVSRDQNVVRDPNVPAAVPVTLAPPSTVASLPSIPAYDLEYAPHQRADSRGSTYIPIDSPIYPMAMRLYSLGYLDTAFIGMRPWTRRSLLHMLNLSADDIVTDGNEQAMGLLARLKSYLADEEPGKDLARGRVYGVETAYTRMLGISGQTLRDSYHLGQTLVNDYGRPYEPGFNNVTGFSSVNEMGRFSLYVRGEYQHSPAGNGYSYAMADALSCADYICPLAPPNEPQATIPYGNTGAQNPFRLQEAVVSFHLLGHEISGGKSDAWLGPGMGGAMAWSNNAENIYSFRINRIEPMYIPLVSKILGPLRYDFFVGSLKGHTNPNSPWVHSEMFSFRPSANFEFGFQRTVIWGGKDHEPITLHTFLRSFFSINDTTGAIKASNRDPGARFAAFNFSYRLPFVRKYATLYVDSEAHDDVTPPSAPRRAAYRPGIFLTQLPFLPKMDLRVEAADTDPPVTRSMGGQFNYFEGVQTQGYTNKGFIMGDWIGREAKGGQAWLTYHLSPDEWVQLEYLNKKNAKDFIPGGTTQNSFKIDVVKHLTRDIQMDAWVQYEHWKAPFPSATTGLPLYFPGGRTDTSIAAQFTWYPKLHATPEVVPR